MKSNWTLAGGERRVTAVLITRESEYPKDVRLDFEFDEVLVETNCRNVLRRYELALQARNDVIYFQDDDASIDIKHLWSQYNGKLTYAITPGHLIMYASTGVALVGWGAFFPKMLIDFRRWEAAYGPVDEMECDRIFTYIAQPHNPVVMPIGQFSRPVKMCERPGHYQTRDKIFKMLKEMA